MPKENKQEKSRKEFYDDFAYKFPKTRLNQVIRERKEKSGFYELCEAFVEAITDSYESDKRERVVIDLKQKVESFCRQNDVPFDNVLFRAINDGYSTLNIEKHPNSFAWNSNERSLLEGGYVGYISIPTIFSHDLWPDIFGDKVNEE